MICSKAQSLLSAYLDRELNGHEMLAVREHLRECPCCREEEEALRTVKLILCQAPCTAPPAGFEERLAAKLRETIEMEQEGSMVRPSKFVRQLNDWWQIYSSRPVFALSTVGLTAFAVAFGSIAVLRNGPTTQTAGTGVGSVGGFGLAQVPTAAEKPKTASKSGSVSRQFFQILDRDHAYITGSSRMGGPESAMVANYVGR